MTPLRIMLTNDDGGASPLFHALFSAVSSRDWCHNATVVVPADEKSWIAQAMSRHNPIFVSTIPESAGYPFDPANCHMVSGTPADCVSLGVYELMPQPPDLVISGINFGTNSGLAFYLSSGTVGASRQAFISGIRSVSFSLSVPLELYELWGANDQVTLRNYSADFARIAGVCAGITEKLWSGSAWNYADLFSVNLPWEATEATEQVVTEMEHTFYLSLFSKRGKNEYLHHPREFPVRKLKNYQELLPIDNHVLAMGQISITPIKYDLRVKESTERAALKALFK